MRLGVSFLSMSIVKQIFGEGFPWVGSSEQKVKKESELEDPNQFDYDMHGCTGDPEDYALGVGGRVCARD